MDSRRAGRHVTGRAETVTAPPQPRGRFVVIEADEPDQSDGRRRRPDGLDGDVGGERRRIAVDPGRDGWERDARGADLVGQGQRSAIAGGQQFTFPVGAAAPLRPDGVDDPAGRESEAWCGLGRADIAAAEEAAMLQQFGPGGAMDRAVDAAAAEQR